MSLDNYFYLHLQHVATKSNKVGRIISGISPEISAFYTYCEKFYAFDETSKSINLPLVFADFLFFNPGYKFFFFWLKRRIKEVEIVRLSIWKKDYITFKIPFRHFWTLFFLVTQSYVFNSYCQYIFVLVARLSFIGADKFEREYSRKQREILRSTRIAKHFWQAFRLRPRVWQMVRLTGGFARHQQLNLLFAAYCRFLGRI